MAFPSLAKANSDTLVALLRLILQPHRITHLGEQSTYKGQPGHLHQLLALIQGIQRRSKDNGSYPKMTSPAEKTSVYGRLPKLVDNPRSIRLLDLAPSRSLGRRSEQIRLQASLRVVSLADSPRFTALSYVWGSPSAKTRTILCDGAEITITQNCHDALVALRRRWSTLTIWVDAICIDQNNPAERSHQVLLMEEIYSWAETVYIWLGPGTTASGAAINWISRLPRSHQCLRPMKLGMASSTTSRLWETFKLILLMLRAQYSLIGETPLWECSLPTFDQNRLLSSAVFPLHGEI